MILKLKVSNFYSIGEEIELDFVKGGKVDEAGYTQISIDKKSSLINGFYGANASGKSNVMRAMTHLIRYMYSDSSCKTNARLDATNKTTTLGGVFKLEDKLYEYDLSITDGKITTESLNSLYSNGSKKNIFTRNSSKLEFGKDYENYSNISNKIILSETKTFMSQIIGLGLDVVSDFIKNKDNFFLYDDSINLHLPQTVNMGSRGAWILSLHLDEKERVLVGLSNILQCFDPSIEKIEVLSSSDKSFKILITHKNFSHQLNIHEESAGTRELFSHIWQIVFILKNGGVVVYDEINKYYHPEIENMILSLFKNTDYNDKGAQLFFSSHNHETMEILDQKQIFIVEKKNKDTKIYPVSAVEDVANRDNLFKKYRSGVLGGVPDANKFSYMLKQML